MNLGREILRERFDYSDGALVWRQSPRPGWKGRIAGTQTPRGYIRVFLDGKYVLAHRIVWAWHHDEWPLEIDHKNGDTSDNRIDNLRPATHSQNTQNASVRKDNSSGVKGVTWHKATNKWMASLQVNKRRVHLGVHEEKEQAIAAVHSARAAHHQQFARHA